MNPYQTLESARPDVGPMPPIARRHLREALFERAERSQRSVGDPEVKAPNTARANAVRLAALALLGLVGVGGLAYSATRDTGGNDPGLSPAATLGDTVPTTPPVRETVVQPPPPTIATTTTEPPVAGTDETPLLLPVGRRRLDELVVVRTALGGSALLLRAPDLSTVALREADGVAPPEPGPPATDDTGATIPPVVPRRIGAIDVTQPGDPGVYEVAVPCGTFVVRDGAGFIPYRPEIVQLLESVDIVDGSIVIRLPAGWTVIGSGPSTEEFTFGLPVEVDGSDVTIRLAQFPNGNLAVAGYDGGQFSPITFRGQPAWLARDPDEPGDFEVIGIFGTTAFRAGASDISLAALGRAMDGLVAGSVDDWIDRFGALPVTGDPDVRMCRPQPSFAVSTP